MVFLAATPVVLLSALIQHGCPLHSPEKDLVTNVYTHYERDTNANVTVDDGDENSVYPYDTY
jgi:hypothetical protein